MDAATLAPGTRLGAYTIVAPLGAGGMGAVYRASDDVLQRPVAVKVLTREGGDPHRELLHEARATSALSHPHICHIYHVGEDGGLPFIAMELVEGRPLSEIVPREGLPTATLLRYAIQLADAVGHAHAHGIVHRDLKGGNVMVTSSGRVKVLDFGLALRTVADVEAVTRSRQQLDEVGTLAGTLPYMAPELLRGEPATARSDVWALGVMLYEMAAGRRPFNGHTAYELTASVFEASPPPLPARVPAALRGIIGRALSADPAARYQHAGEVRAALETVEQVQGVAASETQAAVALPAAAPAARAGRWTWAALGILAAVLAAGALAVWYSPERAAPVLRISGQRLLPLAGGPSAATLSADGRFVAYVAPDADGRPQIWTANVAEGRAVQVTRAEAGAASPFWSPTGEIVFSSGTDVWTVSPLGGAPRRLVGNARNPGVSADGRLVYEGRGVADGNRDVWIARADGSESRRLVSRQSIFPARPAISPDGTQVAYLDYSDGPIGDLWVVPTGDGQARRLTFDDTLMGHLTWAADGRTVIFASMRGGSSTLWSIPASGGAPQPLTTGAGEDDHPAVSADGRALAFTNVRTSWRLVTRDLAGGEERAIAESRSQFIGASVSPDGTQIAFCRPTREGVHLFVMQRDGSDQRQLTATPGEHNIYPRWSADGRSLVYLRTRPEAALRRIPAAGGESVEIVAATVDNLPILSPDGTRVALTRDRRTVLRDLASGADLALPVTLAPDSWSPDGRSFAGTQTTDEDGRRAWKLVVCDTSTAECRTLTDGHSSAWTPDGARLVFLRPGGAHRELWSIGAGGDDLRAHGLAGPYRLDEVWVSVTPDGQVMYSKLLQGTPEIWLADLERR